MYVYVYACTFGERERKQGAGEEGIREREREKGRDYFKELAHKIVEAW